MRRFHFVRIGLLLTVLLLITSLVGSPAIIRAQSGIVGTVVIDLLNVRRAPKASYPVIGQLVRGDVVTLVGRNAAATWLEAATSFGDGWISAQFVHTSAPIVNLPITEGSIGAFVTVAAFPAIVVRSGPELGFPVIGLLFTGQVADIVGTNAQGTWLEVPTTNGNGWIQAQFVTVTGNYAAVPDTGDQVTPVARAVVYRLKVHVAPDVNSDTVGDMHENEVAYIIGTNARRTFWQVRGAFGTGWVAAQFVLATGNLDGVPVVQ